MHRPLASPSPRPWPLHGQHASRRIECHAAAAVPTFTLMQRAGNAVARLAMALAPHARQVWIAAGPGNNGGDGLEAAAVLSRAGMNVCVGLVGDPANLPTDAHLAWRHAVDAGVRIQHGAQPPTPLRHQDIAIDALLGIGANRPPQGALSALLESLSDLPCAVLAVDLPSGLHADTGQPLGPACVNATHTLSLLTLKPGLFTGSGRDHAGDIWFDALGVDTATEPATARLSAPGSPLPFRRGHAGHKGSFGDVAVVGGAQGMTGGALLAARAAHAAGAGRVHVDLLQPDPPGFDGDRPELMFRHGWWRDAPPESLKHATVVAGCGGGDAVVAALPRLLSLVPRLVLDADALNQIASDGALRALLTARAGRGFATVLTPHPLEAARLLGQADAAAVQSDRLAAAESLSATFRCVVVLKGSGSVIAAPDEAPHINPTGNAALATAGTGDVLAGWIAGSWSAMPGSTAREAAVLSAWWHGHAADLSASTPLRAADLVEAMHALRRRDS